MTQFNIQDFCVGCAGFCMTNFNVNGQILWLLKSDEFTVFEFLLWAYVPEIFHPNFLVILQTLKSFLEHNLDLKLSPCVECRVVFFPSS